MISFDEAVALLAEHAKPIGTERVLLDDAQGRVLAEPVTAAIASPSADVSAMDGYAVRDSDLASIPAQLAIVGDSFAGSGFGGRVESGQCTRIFTGAPVPEGADRVVIQEITERTGDRVTIAEDPGKARHIRHRGGDFSVGDTLLPSGRVIDPRASVAVAAADRADIVAYRRPRVAILATGDELAEPGTAAARPHAVPESVSYGIAALAAQYGAQVTGTRRLRDDLPGMEAAAREAVGEANLVVVTGGASVGAKDFAKTMFEPVALQLVFAKIAIKPGKPVWFGRTGDAIVLGLPGNPSSAYVTARLFLVPLLLGLTGRNPAGGLQWRTAPLAVPLDACGARETFHRARVRSGAVEILANQDSSAQRALAEADVLVRQRAFAPAQEAGEPVDILDF